VLDLHQVLQLPFRFGRLEDEFVLWVLRFSLNGDRGALNAN
jgi:hypothetical protein